jgi:hypothetical protein
MKKGNLSFSRMVWIFSLFLTLLPLSLKAADIRPLLRYAAILTRGVNSGGSARILPGHYETAINAQNVNGWPVVAGKKVVLALTAASERPEALIDANNSKCSGDVSQAVTSEAQFQIHIASDHSPASEGSRTPTRSRKPLPRRSIFSSRTVLSTCRQASTAHSLSG